MRTTLAMRCAYYRVRSDADVRMVAGGAESFQYAAGRWWFGAARAQADLICNGYPRKRREMPVDDKRERMTLLVSYWAMVRQYASI